MQHFLNPIWHGHRMWGENFPFFLFCIVLLSLQYPYWACYMAYCIDRILLESDWILNGKLHFWKWCSNQSLLALLAIWYCFQFHFCAESVVHILHIFILMVWHICTKHYLNHFRFFLRSLILVLAFRHNFIILFDMMHRMLVKFFPFLIFCTISGFLALIMKVLIVQIM